MTQIKTMIAERIKQCRLDSGKSQEELGKLLGVTQATMGNYERGDRSPDIEQIQRLAEIFVVPISYLLCVDRIDTIDVTGDAIPGSLRDLKVSYLSLAKYMQDSDIPPDDIKKIVEAVKGIKK